MKPVVKILYAPGINCHEETAAAFKLAGAAPSISLLTADVVRGKQRLTECDLLAIPGGFSFGDHVAAGRLFALELYTRLKEQLLEVREKQIPIIGICNGFQILINTGLLPEHAAIGRPTAIVDRNNSARFESRWCDIYVHNTPTVWTRNLAGKVLQLPVAHGEGRIRLSTEYDETRTILSYGRGSSRVPYPENPNGAEKARAGICDAGGTILGLMPHPERAIYPWLRSEDGLQIFKSGVSAVK